MAPSSASHNAGLHHVCCELPCFLVAAWLRRDLHTFVYHWIRLRTPANMPVAIDQSTDAVLVRNIEGSSLSSPGPRFGLFQPK